MEIIVDVRALWVQVGVDECGTDIIEDRFQVTATARNGNRLAHEVSFENEADAETLAKRVESALRGGHGLRAQYWVPTEPAYGSVAWQAVDADEAADEAMRQGSY